LTSLRRPITFSVYTSGVYAVFNCASYTESFTSSSNVKYLQQNVTEHISWLSTGQGRIKSTVLFFPLNNRRCTTSSLLYNSTRSLTIILQQHLHHIILVYDGKVDIRLILKTARQLHFLNCSTTIWNNGEHGLCKLHFR